MSGRFRLEPVLAQQFDWVRGSDRAITATEIVSPAIQITTPAATFWMFRIQGNPWHEIDLILLRATAIPIHLVDRSELLLDGHAW